MNNKEMVFLFVLYSLLVFALGMYAGGLLL